MPENEMNKDAKRPFAMTEAEKQQVMDNIEEEKTKRRTRRVLLEEEDFAQARASAGAVMEDAKKYEILKEDFKEINGQRVYRIRALKDIDPEKGIVAGMLGGYVASEENLSHSGKCWIADDAVVYEDAKIIGDALVCGKASVYDQAVIGENAQIRDNAVACGHVLVRGEAKICDDAAVKDYASVMGASVIAGRAKVYDSATVLDGKVDMNARIFDEAKVQGATVSSTACVYGGSEITGESVVQGNSRIYGNAKSRRALCFHPGRLHLHN